MRHQERDETFQTIFITNSVLENQHWPFEVNKFWRQAEKIFIRNENEMTFILQYILKQPAMTNAAWTV